MQATKIIRRTHVHAARQDLGLVITEEKCMDYEALPDPSQSMATCLDVIMKKMSNQAALVIELNMGYYLLDVPMGMNLEFPALPPR